MFYEKGVDKIMEHLQNHVSGNTWFAVVGYQLSV